MTDEVMQELWAIKDGIAREHGYDLARAAAFYLHKQAERMGAASPQPGRRHEH